jgi:hypothetical protein
MIVNFVPLEGYVAEVKPAPSPKEENTNHGQVIVAGVGLVNKQWVICAIDADGVLKPVTDLVDKIIDVQLVEDDEDDDE